MGLNGKNGTLVGVLAVQGDFDAHARALRRVGVTPLLVKHPGDVALVEGLILPGGESTTVLKFLAEEAWSSAIRAASESGTPLFGTCAGAILMASEVENPPQSSLGLMDICIRRNAYGRQVSSFVAREALCGDSPSEPLEMVFIRAPIIERIGPDVQILGECRGRPVLVRQGHLLASTFHPELTPDPRVHRLFLSLIEGRSRLRG